MATSGRRTTYRRIFVRLVHRWSAGTYCILKEMPRRTAEELNELSKGHLPELFGFQVVKFDAGRVQAQMPIRQELLAPNGFLHAASVIALADTACGYGVLADLPDGACGFTTIELKTN